MRRPLVVLVVVAVASGCAWRGDVKRLRTEVAELTGSVNALKQSASATSAPADEAARMEIKKLGAQVATVESRIGETAAHLSRLDARLAAAERAAQETAAKLDAIQGSVTKLQGSLAPRTPPPPPPSGAGGSAAPRAAIAPEAAYATALRTFRAREHGQAVLEFLDFLARHPKHPLAPAAQYWIGEAYFVQRDYRQAIVEFEKVLEHGVGNSKVPDALVRAGMAWNSLRDSSRAGELWRRVVREYPKSDAARTAAKLLAGLRTDASRR